MIFELTRFIKILTYLFSHEQASELWQHDTHKHYRLCPREQQSNYLCGHRP